MKTRLAVLVVMLCVALSLASPNLGQTSRAIARPGSAMAGAMPQAGAAVLSVTNGFATQPGGVNPLAGRTLTLLKESFEHFLRRTGMFAGPPGSTVKVSPLLAWAYSCKTAPQVCQQALYEMQGSVAAYAKMEANGRMTLPGVPPGTYYLFAFTVYNNQPLIWDLRVDLRPGANAVTLNQSNVASLDANSARSNPSAGRGQSVADSQPCPGTDAPTPARPGARADSALSVVGTGYVYTYTETNRFGQVVNSFTERGNFTNTTLYLLDEDADSILQQAGVQPGLLGSRLATFTLMDAGTQVENVPGMSAITSLFGQGGREEVAEFTRERKAEFECVMKAIRAHSVAQMTTNAAARGLFPRVPAGTYYLFGRFYRITKPARGGGVLWNLRVTLKPGQNALRLSVDNAALK